MNLRMAITQDLKEALRSFGEEIQTHNFKIHNMNEITRQKQSRSPEHCLKIDRWQVNYLFVLEGMHWVSENPDIQTKTQNCAAGPGSGEVNRTVAGSHFD